MVNICKQKLTSLQQDLLRFLFMKAGKEFNARELSLELNVTRMAISKSIPKIEKLGYIIVKKNKRYSITLNILNPEITGLKRADNLKILYESGLVDYLYRQLPGATIQLFGSFSIGEDIYDSDIDIAVIGIKPRTIKLDIYQEILGKEIIINFYPSFDKIDKHLLNNILNGITLKGGISL